MKGLKYIKLAIAALLATTASAQDIHFSQFNMSPLTLNPALTGAYEGTFRIGGIYRNQWASIIKSGGYTTPSIYLDAPVVRGFGKNDWLGAGLVVLQDKSGRGLLTNTTAMLSLAYHIGLGTKGNSILTIGANGGVVQKKFDQSTLVDGNTLVNNINATSGTVNETFSNTNISYPDFGLGLLFNHTLTSKMNFNLGASMAHLLEPKETFSNVGTSNLARRISAHGGLNVDLTDKLTLSPSVIYQTQAKASETNVQALLGYHLNPQKDVTVIGGLGYRINQADALYPTIGMNYKGLKVGVAYDVNMSGLNTATQGNGAFEIGLSYIAKISKMPVVKPVLFCPRF